MLHSIGGAILLALLYQWWTKKKGSNENFNKDYDKYKFESRKIDKMKDMSSLKGGLAAKKANINKLRDDIDNLTKNAQTLESSLGRMGNNSILKDLDSDGYEDIISKKIK